MSETENPEQETMYAILDMSTLEGISFLKRAPLNNILLWQKVYAMEGKPTKRLDLLTTSGEFVEDVQKTAKFEELQYLYYNTTSNPPPVDYSDENYQMLSAECERLANEMTVDETSYEELKSQIPVEMLQSPSQKRKEQERKMGQGSEVQGALDKPVAPKRKTAEEKAGEKLAKEFAKAELKAQKKADSDAKKAAAKAAKPAKVKAPKAPKGSTSTLKAGDVLTGRYKGADHKVNVVSTPEGLGFEYNGTVYATRTLAGKAIFAPFGLPENRSLKLNLVVPANASNGESNGGSAEVAEVAQVNDIAEAPASTDVSVPEQEATSVAS